MDNLVWFVDRIEKDNFKINSHNSKEKIKILLELFKRTKGYKEKFNNIFDAIEYAEKNIEYESSVNSRILHKFSDGHYFINLTEKELGFEAFQMSNCVSEMSYSLRNKIKALIALKDSKHKTVCHIEIDRAGTLCQHYQKANMPVSFKRWEYINEFFKKYEDKEFYQKIKNSNLQNLYSINRSNFNNLPTINSIFPTKYSTSIFDSENKEFSSFIFLKEYSNTNTYKFDKNKRMNIKEIEEELNNFKNYINKSLDEIILSIKNTKENYFVLSDEIIKKIYGKIFFDKNEKIEFIINSEKYPMILMEEEGLDFPIPIPVEDRRFGVEATEVLAEDNETLRDVRDVFIAMRRNAENIIQQEEDNIVEKEYEDSCINEEYECEAPEEICQVLQSYEINIEDLPKLP